MSHPNKTIRRQRSAVHRHGKAMVEFAFIAIPLFVFVFTSIEFGRAMMAAQSLEEAARSGCRAAILNGATEDDVDEQIDTLLGLAGITVYDVDILVDGQSTPLDQALQWDPITVTISAQFDDVSWLPLPRFMTGKGFTASCTLPREGDEESLQGP